nr:MAG TPA: hypothetical protein [Caudoviricetes sp.]
MTRMHIWPRRYFHCRRGHDTFTAHSPHFLLTSQSVLEDAEILSFLPFSFGAATIS